MDFNFISAVVREVANGSLSLSALLLILIFARYCWRNRRSFWYNRTVQVAGGVLVLMTGHWVRASGAWLEFYLTRRGVNLAAWLTHSWTWFATAVVLILFGKALMLYSFAPKTWRWGIIVPGMIFCATVPLIIVVITSN